MTTNHHPMRTCIGCRQRDAQVTLARLVASDGTLVVDTSRRLPGRGAYLHRRRACVDAFTRRGGFVRSLRRVVAKGEREALRAGFPEVEG